MQPDNRNPFDAVFARLPRFESKVTLAIFGVIGLLVIGMCIFGSLSFLALSERFSAPQTEESTVDLREVVKATQTAFSRFTPTPGEEITSPVGSPTLPAQNLVYPTLVIRPSNINIEELVAKMSLKEKIGQMLLSGLNGQAAGEQASMLVNQYYLGGVVYFGDNTGTPDQVLRFSQELQRLAMNNPHAIPLLVSIDHEGGSVFRFQSGMTHFPNLMTLGAANNPDLTYNVAAANAWELRAVGINTSLGPVLDINDDPANPVIGLRAFGGIADLVTRMGEQYIAGLQQNGMIATAKHFPGHGSTNIDSHSTLPVVNKSLDQLRMNELIPFMQAVRSSVGIIMVGHIANLIVDPSGLPASLSPIFIQDILRGELGFEGVVMTDALTMGAVTEKYDIPSAAVKSIQAGVDIVAVTGPDFAGGAYAAILQAVRSGAISMQRIDESVRRILLLKAQYGLFEEAIPAGGSIDLARGEALARQVAQSAIVHSGGEFHSLANDSGVLLVSPDRLPSGNDPNKGLSRLGEFLSQHGLRVEEWIYPLENPSQIAAVQQQVLQSLPSYSTVVLGTYDAQLRLVNQGDGAQRDLLNAILTDNMVASRQVNIVVVTCSSPYDLALVPEWVPALSIFGTLESQIEALADVLLGKALPGGVMPVVIER
jgi:beta-N-acetylhexosaminidase